uniref:aberrant root formation protein 4 n=1 Tax=Erigeron canadensis TaxID=72917 RepID=UPI001CB89251|nr:aberrant root formation protein 4 [Erigeron canadensis]
MSAENPNSMGDFLQQTLASCSNSIKNGDFKQSDEYISELVTFLDSISDTKDELEYENLAFEALSQIYHYLISPSLDQAVTDELAFELPKAVAKLACASARCFENAERIIDRFVETCSPRDMVSILCEAMVSPSDGFSNSYFTPLFGALAKVFEALQRRTFEQVKAALPVVLKALEVTLSDPEDEDTGLLNLLNKAILIAHSLKAVCQKMDHKDEKLVALFSLYVLQIMALISNSLGAETSKCFPMTSQLSHLLQYCGLSYLGLITGHEVDTTIDLLSQGDEVDYINCFSYVRSGAVLTVLWKDFSCEVADATKEDLDAVKDELRSDQMKRWQAVGMLKHTFASVNLPWALKRHAIDFLFCIMEGVDCHQNNDETMEHSEYMPTLYAALQAIQLVIVYASDPLLRKRAFDTFKMVLADLSPSLRFDILMALIRNSELSSMIAILLGLVKDEMFKEYPQKVSKEIGDAKQENDTFKHSSPFWTVSVLDCVEFVLKPPKGGPPCLPEFTDAVLSALNLYRFILITESSGNTNYTEVLSKINLQKVYREWLEPLRALVSSVAVENHKDNDQLAFDAVCALNPVEFVLYRCIELVEENLKHRT